MRGGWLLVALGTASGFLAEVLLDIAKQRVPRAGFLVDVSGGGVFGVVRDENWPVASQDPPGGNTVERGSTVTLDVERG